MISAALAYLSVLCVKSYFNAERAEIRRGPQRESKSPREQMLSRAFELIPATSYSPTQFPAQYHRLQQA